MEAGQRQKRASPLEEPKTYDKERIQMEYLDIINANIRQVSPAWDEAVGRLIHIFLEAREHGKSVYFIGNGGSAGIAVHMAADFQKTGGFRTRTFYDPALITCMANDYGYEYVFSKPLELYAEPGDVLVAISSSGNSMNIINAAKTAGEHHCKVVTLTGFSANNTLHSMGDLNIHVPSFAYGVVESLHNLMLQQVMDEIEAGRTE